MSEQPLNPEPGSKPDPKKDKPAKSKIPPGRKETKEPEHEHHEGEAPAPLPIRPRTAVTKSKEQPAEETPVEKDTAKEKEPEKEKAPNRLKPSGKPYGIRKSTKEPVAEDAPEPDINEEPEDEIAEPEPATAASASEPKPKVKRPSILGRALRLRVPLVPALVVIVLVGVMAGVRYYNNGVAEGLKEAERRAQREYPPLPPEVVAKLDAAILNLRTGHAPEALKALTELEAANAYPSMTFLVALAALQSGDMALVEEKARLSIKKREKVSDSLALLAVVESQQANDKSRVKMGSSIKRSEGFLAQAVAADPANPYPRFELATLLRYDRRKEEAAVQLKGARWLLNPIDSHSIMDITTGIMRLEVLPEDQLPGKIAPSDNPVKLIPAAYAAMRRGDFEDAAAMLRAAREVMSAESFDYLINDPAMRRFAREAQLAEFYGN